MVGKVIFVSLICAVLAKPQGLGLDPIFSNPISSDGSSKPLENSPADVSSIPFIDGNRTSSDHILFLTNFQPASSSGSSPSAVQQVRSSQSSGDAPIPVIRDDETSSNSSSGTFLRQPFRPSPVIHTQSFHPDVDDSQINVRKARQAQGSFIPISSASDSTVRQPLNPTSQSQSSNPLAQQTRQGQSSAIHNNPQLSRIPIPANPSFVRQPVNPSVQSQSFNNQPIRNRRQVQGSPTQFSPTKTGTIASPNGSVVRHPISSPVNSQSFKPVENGQLIRNNHQVQGSFTQFSPSRIEGDLIDKPANPSIVRQPINPSFTGQPLPLENGQLIRNARQIQGSFPQVSTTNSEDFVTVTNFTALRRPVNPIFASQSLKPSENSQFIENTRQVQSSFASSPTETDEDVAPIPVTRNIAHSIVRQPFIQPESLQSGAQGSQFITRQSRQIQPEIFPEESEEESEETPFEPADDQLSFSAIPQGPLFESEPDVRDSGVEVFPQVYDRVVEELPRVYDSGVGAFPEN